MRSLDAVAQLPIRRPVLVLAVLGILTLVLGAGLLRLRINASIEAMMVDADADHIEFEARKSVFGSDEVVSVAIPFGDAPLGMEFYAARTLFREALLDAEAEIGATELGRLIVSTWRRTSVSLPAQKPDEAVRGFVDQLQADANVAAAISVAFAKVGLVVPAAEVEPAD